MTRGEQAVEPVRRHRPDVVLMDIRMPRLDGIEATRRITAEPELVGVRIVMLTTFDADDYVHAAIRAGASGFLLKDAPPEDVLDAVRVVAQGDALLAPSVTRRLIAELASRPDPDRPAPPELGILTDRKREVLALVGRGLSNAEVGTQLYVTRGYSTYSSHALPMRFRSVTPALTSPTCRRSHGKCMGSTGEAGCGTRSCARCAPGTLAGWCNWQTRLALDQ